MEMRGTCSTRNGLLRQWAGQSVSRDQTKDQRVSCLNERGIGEEMVDDVIDAARRIRDQRYSDAAAILAAGSIIRGEGTAYSDLDLVVVYPKIAYAYRESYRFEKYPVEAFVHDPETLNYFFLEVDRPSGVPSLPQMVIEGIEIPGPTDVSRSSKKLDEIEEFDDDFGNPRCRGAISVTAADTLLCGKKPNRLWTARFVQRA